MLRFEWNALRAGDRVVVHDPASPEMTLLPGAVAMVDTYLGRKGANGVGIRMAEGEGSTRILWPSYLAVHRDPLDPSEPCWRCRDRARRASEPPVAVAPDRVEAREVSGAPAPQRCGRCRGVFPGDTTLALDRDAGWWACPPCHDLLLGAVARTERPTEDAHPRPVTAVR